MDKMLDKYLNILSRLDVKVEKFKEEDDDERRLKFIQMATEAEKGRVRADMIHDIGAITAAHLVKNLDIDFTFEDFLAEFDRLVSK